MSNEKQLAVLDMSEEEQYNWLAENKILPQYAYRDTRTATLADLAFRLRDESVNKNYSNWLHAGQTVYDYTKKEFPYRTPGYLTWFSVSAKPIHWIIASLIAKGKSK